MDIACRNHETTAMVTRTTVRLRVAHAAAGRNADVVAHIIQPARVLAAMSGIQGAGRVKVVKGERGFSSICLPSFGYN